jgi:hypothetical protein
MSVVNGPMALKPASKAVSAKVPGRSMDKISKERWVLPQQRPQC